MKIHGKIKVVILLCLNCLCMAHTFGYEASPSDIVQYRNDISYPDDNVTTMDVNHKVAPNKYYGPYCGIYCLYAVMQLYEIPCGFSELIRPEYVGSSSGSTIEDILHAARDYKLNAISLKNLSPSFLEQVHVPVILHVKSSLEIGKYDHYSVFLGMKGNRATIFDPPNKIQSVPLENLLPRWNGAVILLSRSPLNIQWLLLYDYLRLFASIVVCIIVAPEKCEMPNKTGAK